MSLLCLYFIENISEKDKKLCVQQIENNSKSYNCGVKFCIDWQEPFISNIVKENTFIVNIIDSPTKDNCDFFLIPDAWFINGKTNDIAFNKRMFFLEEIARVFLNINCSVDLYIGQSGTELEDFTYVLLNNKNLVDYLSKSIGIYGAEDALHIHIM